MPSIQDTMKSVFKRSFDHEIEWEGKTYIAVAHEKRSQPENSYAPCCGCAFNSGTRMGCCPTDSQGIICPPSKVWKEIDPLLYDLKKVKEMENDDK